MLGLSLSTATLTGLSEVVV